MLTLTCSAFVITLTSNGRYKMCKTFKHYLFQLLSGKTTSCINSLCYIQTIFNRQTLYNLENSSKMPLGTCLCALSLSKR